MDNTNIAKTESCYEIWEVPNGCYERFLAGQTPQGCKRISDEMEYLNLDSARDALREIARDAADREFENRNFVAETRLTLTDDNEDEVYAAADALEENARREYIANALESLHCETDLTHYMVREIRNLASIEKHLSARIRNLDWPYAESPLEMITTVVQGQLMRASEGEITMDNLEEPIVCGICNAIAVASLRDALDDESLGGIASAFAIALTRAGNVARQLVAGDSYADDVLREVVTQNHLPIKIED